MFVGGRKGRGRKNREEDGMQGSVRFSFISLHIVFSHALSRGGFCWRERREEGKKEEKALAGHRISFDIRFLDATG